MEKPIKPNVEDCCNSGCSPCIFDIYDKQFELYKKYLKGECVNNHFKDNAISQLKYSEFIVNKNVSICDSHNYITFRKLNGDNIKVWWKPGDHFLCKFISDTVSCTRAYTPIQLDNEHEEGNDFSIVVKKYEHGLVSQYLCSLNKGDITFWRGPYGHYKLEPNEFKRIIMIAQGTGIAPFITIINNILNDEDNMTKIILLYCCRCEKSILFREELYAFKSYWNFKYEIFLGSWTTSTLEKRYQEPVRCHKLSNEHLNNIKPFHNDDQILLCGSPKFNTDYYIFFSKAGVPRTENIVLF